MERNHKEVVLCSQCGRDVSKISFLALRRVGLCNKCKRIYCIYCVDGFKQKKCPVCGERLIITGIIKQYPPGFGNPHFNGSLNQPQQLPMTQVIINTPSNAVKICDRCGYQNSSTAKFCNECGSSLEY